MSYDRSDDDRTPWEEVTFTVTCTMKRRWASQFLGMLKRMQRLGGVGASRPITFFSDGDGDYRPKFEVSGNAPEPAEGLTPDDVKPGADEFSRNNVFDAG